MPLESRPIDSPANGGSFDPVRVCLHKGIDASRRAQTTMPPFCIIHGTHDGVVPAKDADPLVRQCLDAGVDFSYNRFHGGTHCMEERQQITNRLIRKFLAEITP